MFKISKSQNFVKENIESPFVEMNISKLINYWMDMC